MTKQEWREKAEEVKSDTIKSIIDDLLSHDALRNSLMPQKREVTIPWSEVEGYLEKLVEIDEELDERTREAGSLSKNLFERQ